MSKQQTFQFEDGGSNPTPSLHSNKAHQRIIRDKLKEKEGELNKPSNLKVSKTIVKEISYEFAKNIILKYEWLGTMANTTRHFGIFFENKCGGVVCFGRSLAGNCYIERMFGISKKELWVLARGACVHWAPVNTNSKLIGTSLKQLKKVEPNAKVVIAYSDPQAGEIGTVYQATNWLYLGKGRSRTCVLKENGNIIHSRYFSQKGGIKAMKKYIKENPGSRIYWEKEQPKKGRYTFILANKKEKKKILEKIDKKIKTNYPKRIKEK